MALDQILRKIDTQARSEAQRIREEAQLSARAQVEGWKARGEAEAGEVLGRAAREVERQTRQAGAEARLESGKAILARKREWLGKAAATARKRLLEDQRLYREILQILLERHAQGEVTEVVFSGDDVASRMAKDWSPGKGARITVAGADQEPRGGIIIRKGPVSLDFSFSRLLEEIAQKQQIDSHRILFGDARE